MVTPNGTWRSGMDGMNGMTVAEAEGRGGEYAVSLRALTGLSTCRSAAVCSANPPCSGGGIDVRWH